MHRNFLIISGWNTVFRKLIVAHLIKKFPPLPFHGNRKFHCRVNKSPSPVPIPLFNPHQHNYTLYMAFVIRNILAPKTLKTVRYLVRFRVIPYTCNSQNILSPYKIYFNITLSLFGFYKWQYFHQNYTKASCMLPTCQANCRLIYCTTLSCHKLCTLRRVCVCVFFF